MLGVWTLSKNRTKNWPGNKKKTLYLRGAAIKKSNGIKYITRRSPQIQNTGSYRKIFGDFLLARMGDCMGIFNCPSDFSLAVGDWASGSLYPCPRMYRCDHNHSTTGAAPVWEFSIAHPIFHSPWATGRVGVFIPAHICIVVM